MNIGDFVQVRRPRRDLPDEWVVARVIRIEETSIAVESLNPACELGGPGETRMWIERHAKGRTWR
jgi:hypothetical protein